MIEDEFEVCFELLLSVMLAKRRMEQGVPVRVPCQSHHIPGAQKKKKHRPRYVASTPMDKDMPVPSPSEEILARLPKMNINHLHNFSVLFGNLLLILILTLQPDNYRQ
jgi:hypothetical protein